MSHSSVIRSPLEVLAEESTPPHQTRQPPRRSPQRELHAHTSTPHDATPTTLPTTAPRQQTVSAVGTLGATVTETRSNKRIPVPFGATAAAAGGGTMQSQHQNEGVVDAPSVEAERQPPAVHTSMPSEEPSALLFLSPGPQRPSKHPHKTHHSSRRKSSPSATSVTSEATCSTNVAEGDEDERHKSRRSSTRKIPQIDEASVHDMIAAALEAYEQRRDEEEAVVLERIQVDMNAVTLERDHWQRVAEDQRSKSARDAELLSKLEAQCTMLAETTQSVHNDLIREQARCKQLEVQLVHAEDARRLLTAEHARSIEFERAQSEAAREEMEAASQRIANDHRKEVESLQFELHEESSRIQELNAALRAATQKAAAATEQVQTLSTEQGTLMNRCSQLQAEVESQAAQLVELKKRASGMEKADHVRKHDQSALQERIRALEDATRQQSDDLRKKMHRIQVLESEMEDQRLSSVQLEKYAATLEQRLELIFASSEGLWSSLRVGSQRRLSQPLLAGGNPAGTTTSSSTRERDCEGLDASDDDDSDQGDMMDGWSGNDNDDNDAAADECEAFPPPQRLSRAPPQNNKDVHRILTSKSTGALRGVTDTTKQPQSRSNSAAASSRRTSPASRTTSATTSKMRSAHSNTAQTEPNGSVSKAARKKQVLQVSSRVLQLLGKVHEHTHRLLRALHVQARHQDEAADSLRRQRDTFEHRVRELETLLTSALNEKASLSGDLAAIQQRHAQSRESMTKLSEEFGSQQRTVAHLEYDAKRLREEVQQSQFEANERRVAEEQVRQQLADTRAKLTAVDFEKQELEQRLRAADVALDAANAQVHARQLLIDDAERRAADLTRECVNLAQHKERLQKSLYRHQNELTASRGETERLRTELQAVQLRVTKLEASLQSARKAAAAATAKPPPSAPPSVVTQLQEERLAQERGIKERAALQSKIAEEVALREEVTTKLRRLEQKRTATWERWSWFLQEGISRMQFVVESIQRLCESFGTATNLLSVATAATTMSPTRTHDGLFIHGNTNSDTSTNASSDTSTSDALDDGAQKNRKKKRYSRRDHDDNGKRAAKRVQHEFSATLHRVEQLFSAVSSDWAARFQDARRQLLSQQQTITFLEIEMACQKSQQKKQRTSGAGTSPAVLRDGDRIAAPPSSLSPAHVSGPLSFVDLSSSPEPLVHQQHRGTSAAHNGQRGATLSFSPQPQPQRRNISENQQQQQPLSKSVSALFPVTAASASNQPSLTFNNVTQPSAATKPRHETPPRQRTPQRLPGTQLPQFLEVSAPNSPAPQQPPSLPRTAVVTMDQRNEGRITASAKDPATTTAAAKKGSSMSVSPPSTEGSASRSVDGLSASPMRPPSLRSSNGFTAIPVQVR